MLALDYRRLRGSVDLEDLDFIHREIICLTGVGYCKHLYRNDNR
jgi:hypothetical protein